MLLCSEKADLTEETLEKQYEVVKKRTSNNYTYNMGSHVMQFGSLSIDEEPAGDYLGELNTGVHTGICSAVALKPALSFCHLASLSFRSNDVQALFRTLRTSALGEEFLPAYSCARILNLCFHACGVPEQTNP